MESPKENLEDLKREILLFEDDLNVVFAARQVLITTIKFGKPTPKDIQDYIVLSKRNISTMERKLQTMEKIHEYYQENDPDNIERKIWSNELEANQLKLEAHKSDLDDFLNNNDRTEKTSNLFSQYFIARHKADDFATQVDHKESPNQKPSHLPGLAKAFFEAPGTSYETLVLGKFVKPDGTELNLPNCGINSFSTLQTYGEKFEHDLSPLIQKINQSTAHMKIRILASTYGSNPKVLEVLQRVEKMNEAETKKTEELRTQLKKIQQSTVLPVTIDEQLETDLLGLDRLHAELKKIMLDANQAQSELKALTT